MTDENEYIKGTDPNFLKDTIEWAKGYEWKKSNGKSIDDHDHCWICNRPLKTDDDNEKYESSTGYICGYCFDHFIKENQES